MHYIGTKKSRVCSWAARKSCLWYVSRGMRETVIIFLWVTKPTKYQCNTKNPLPFFRLSNMTHGDVLWYFSFHLIHMFSDHSMFHGWVTTPISEVLIEHMEYYTSVWSHATGRVRSQFRRSRTSLYSIGRCSPMSDRFAGSVRSVLNVLPVMMDSTIGVSGHF